MNLPVSRSARFLLTICASIALVTSGHAAPKLKPKPKIAYMAIASIDPTAMTLTIEAKNSTATVSKTYKFTAQTKITVNGHDGTATDLKPGQQIRVGTGPDEKIADQLTASNPPADSK